MAQGVQCFAARWSLSVWVITVLVIVVVICATAGLLWAAAEAAPAETVARALLTAAAFVPAVILCVTVLFAPLGYTVHRKAILVNRMGRPVVIACRQIAEIRRIDAAEIGFAVRIAGSGGFFGAFGRFYSRRLGRFRAYITNRNDLILVTQADGTKTVLSPSPADVFVETVEKAREAAVWASANEVAGSDGPDT